MDIDDSITVTKLYLQNERGYLMIRWQQNSFDVYLYENDNIWKGKFSTHRLAGFSKNLNLSKNEYYENAKRCLSQRRRDYRYEIKSGFFYWRRKYRDSEVLEGFLPMELDTSPPSTRPDLLEITLVLNKYLKGKIKELQRKYEHLKTDYSKCVTDTEEFLNLKIEMEKGLCAKFLNLLNLKTPKTEPLERRPGVKIKDGTELKQSKLNELSFSEHE